MEKEAMEADLVYAARHRRLGGALLPKAKGGAAEQSAAERASKGKRTEDGERLLQDSALAS